MLCGHIHQKKLAGSWEENYYIVLSNLLLCSRLTLEIQKLWSPVLLSLFKSRISLYFGLVLSPWCPRSKRSGQQSSARSLKTWPWLSRAETHTLGYHEGFIIPFWCCHFQVYSETQKILISDFTITYIMFLLADIDSIE